LVSDPQAQAAATASMGDTAISHMKDLLRKDTNGEFVIERLLGRGGMAAVFLATEVRLARKVAIKVLPPALTFGHGVERFMREAKTVASLDHPGIVPIYRISSGRDIFWYAMKYLEGRSLEDYLAERKRCTLGETIAILTQVAEALDYAHQRGVIHRDVKPGNAMLDSRNRVVMTDFGIAKAVSDGSLTASGAVVGSPYYLSPEQGTGKEVSGAADQYSVGVMAYRMLSGQVPFEGDTSVNVIIKHCSFEPPPLDVFCPNIPKPACAAVHRALLKPPADRWPTVTAFVHAMRGPSGDTVEIHGRGVGRRRRLLTRIGTSVALVIVVVLTSWGISSGRGKRAALATASLFTQTYARIVGNETPSGTVQTPVQPDSAVESEVPPATPPAPTPAPTQTETPRPRPRPAAPTTGSVRVVDLPGEGNVLVNGERQSGRDFRLRPGEYIIEMTAPGLEVMRRTITVAAGKVRELQFVGTPLPPSALRMSVRPGMTAVFLDEKKVAEGENRIFLEGLRPGEHQLRFTLEGYVTFETTITLEPGDTTTFVRVMTRSQ
jgi:serine/threonine-protein kinase